MMSVSNVSAGLVNGMIIVQYQNKGARCLLPLTKEQAIKLMGEIHMYTGVMRVPPEPQEPEEK